ncbi:MAG: hypothetical protein RQ952_07045 [Thermoproteota archaeon]|jgi:hypothetical protein|nr:hypothetical protein [Thermoproteota archaeon]
MVAKKIIAVVAEWEASSKYVKKIVEEVSKEKNIQVEIKEEDWEFLVNYGVKDEFGGVEVPQVFVQDDNGNIKFVMGRVPLDAEGKPDLNKAKEILLQAISTS